MWIHTVVEGDTVQSIAEQYGTTTREVNRLNEIGTQDTLVPGLHLVVPGPSVGVRPYTIQSGDTLTSISRKAGIPLPRLQRWTGMTANTALMAGQTLYLPQEIPQANRPTIEANGYLLPTGTSSDSNILRDVPSLTYVCMFSYQARVDGSLQPPKDTLALQTAKELNIAPLLTVTNFDGNNFNTQLAHTILANGSIRRRLIDNLARTMTQQGFRGVNVDFEHMAPSDRPLYNAFIRDLKNTMRSSGFSTSIAMGPKTSDEPTASWMGAFDYRTLGQEVDFLMLMTYEWGWVGGPPMAIAPLNQVRAVLDYATSVVQNNKILMGMALYGYDWPLPHTPGKRASGVSNLTAQKLAMAQQVPIQWDSAAQSPYFRYRASDGVDHEVWFEDALSTLIKFQLVQDLNLHGLSYWVMGQESPWTYYLMTDRFNVRKLPAR